MTPAIAARTERKLEALTRQIEKANHAGQIAKERALTAEATQLLAFYHSALGLSPENSAVLSARYGWVR